MHNDGAAEHGHGIIEREAGDSLRDDGHAIGIGGVLDRGPWVSAVLQLVVPTNRVRALAREADMNVPTPRARRRQTREDAKDGEAVVGTLHDKRAVHAIDRARVSPNLDDCMGQCRGEAFHQGWRCARRTGPEGRR
mgnify:CR=1 FL=1